jgi:A/G-specific adenine glycosylase
MGCIVVKYAPMGNRSIKVAKGRAFGSPPAFGLNPRASTAEEPLGAKSWAPAAADFRRRLLAWYRRQMRDLPWRRTSDPYAIWISEIMLQQTTVGAVIPYYERWLKVFPDIRSLAAAPLRRVLKAWQGLGYYARARNLHAAAKAFAKHHGGRIPDDYDTLRSIPGFGPYTAAAVLSLAYRKPFPVLEANVRRVVMRLLGLHGQADGRHDRVISGRLRELIARKSPGDFNQAMMELGAIVCRPRSPLCPGCPVQAFCVAFAAGEQEVIPRPKKVSYHKIEAVIGIIEDDGRVLIQQRPETGLLAGLWEFPGGKMLRGEGRIRALAREIREETGAEISGPRYFMTVNHSYTQYQVTLHAFRCALKTVPLPEAGARLRWVRLRDLRKYPFPSGSAKIIRRLEETDRPRYGGRP